MKKITPDPPPIDLSLKFQVPPGTTLAAAIINSQVCIQDVLMNACLYFLLSYNSVQKAYRNAPKGSSSIPWPTACRTSRLPGARSMRW